MFYTLCLVTLYTSLSVCTNHLNCTQTSVPGGTGSPGKLPHPTHFPYALPLHFRLQWLKFKYHPQQLHLPQNFSNPHLISLPCLGPETSVERCKATVQQERPNWERGSALMSVLTCTNHSLIHPSLQTHPHQPSTGSKMLSFQGFWHRNIFPSDISHLPL